MKLALIILVALVAALHLYRQFWMHRKLPRLHTAEFEGVLLRVGETYIGHKPAAVDTRKTLVCFPGFLEDMRYFQALYADVDCQLLLVNNANYHSPFDTSEVEPLNWPANPYPLGSIEYDGFYLAHTVKELAVGSEVFLHGHSRGGAVVLEAGRQFPELMRDGQRQISAILEAPVLPRVRSVGNLSDPFPHRVAAYLLPIVLGHSRKTTPQQLSKQRMMLPGSELKTQLCLSLFSVAQYYRTCVANVRSIQNWQLGTEFEVYQNFADVTVVMGARDDVLNNKTILASAQKGSALNSGVRIIQTENTNHFVSLEQPHYLQQLIKTGL